MERRSVPDAGRGAASARVFFALWPDPPAAARLDALGRQQQIHCRGRLMRRDTLHLTLAFVGEVQRERIADLGMIAQQVHVPAFSMRLDVLGSWTHNRLAWVGISRAPPELLHLADELAGRLRVAGLPIDVRPFKPHVTLLRRITVPLAEQTITPVTWQATEFKLVESVHMPAGSHYRALGAWQLGG